MGAGKSIHSSFKKRKIWTGFCRAEGNRGSRKPSSYSKHSPPRHPRLRAPGLPREQPACAPEGSSAKATHCRPATCTPQPPGRGKNAQFLSRHFSPGTHFTRRKRRQENKITSHLIPCLYRKLGAAYQSQEQPRTKPNLSPFCCCFEEVLKHCELHPGVDGCLQGVDGCSQGAAPPQCYPSKHAWLGLGGWSLRSGISGL